MIEKKNLKQEYTERLRKYERELAMKLRSIKQDETKKSTNK
jgi:hypothetical protein